jgi:hypothetical protein
MTRAEAFYWSFWLNLRDEAARERFRRAWPGR